MAKPVKIDTSLLRQLADELDAALTISQDIKQSGKPDKDTVKKFIVEMAKAAGLAGGVAQEATALIMDINQEVRAVQSPPPDYDSLKELLGLKAPGGYGGGGGSFN
jgi:hypothetical protein